MKFLADMGISPRVVEKLQAEGYQAVHLYELDLMKMSDADILKKARKEKISFSHMIWILASFWLRAGESCQASSFFV